MSTALFKVNLPQIIVPRVIIHQPDGSYLIKPGKAILADDEISTREAARLLGLSQRHIETQCAEGLFRTAYKPGGRPRSKWRLARAEVEARRAPPAD